MISTIDPNHLIKSFCQTIPKLVQVYLQNIYRYQIYVKALLVKLIFLVQVHLHRFYCNHRVQFMDLF